MSILTFIFIISLSWGKVFLFTDLVFCSIIFQSTFAEAAVRTVDTAWALGIVGNRIKMEFPPLSSYLAMST